MIRGTKRTIRRCHTGGTLHVAIYLHPMISLHPFLIAPPLPPARRRSQGIRNSKTKDRRAHNPFLHSPTPPLPSPLSVGRLWERLFTFAAADGIRRPAPRGRAAVLFFGPICRSVVLPCCCSVILSSALLSFCLSVVLLFCVGSSVVLPFCCSVILPSALLSFCQSSFLLLCHSANLPFSYSATLSFLSF